MPSQVRKYGVRWLPCQGAIIIYFNCDYSEDEVRTSNYSMKGFYEGKDKLLSSFRIGYFKDYFCHTKKQTGLSSFELENE